MAGSTRRGAGSIRRIDRPKPWQARYVAPDGRERSRSFFRKADAERWLRAEQVNVDRGEWIDPKAGTVTFAEWSETWLAGLTDLKPKTKVGYEGLLRSRVVPTFGTTQLRRITPAAVRTWLADMEAEGLSAARRRQARQVLAAALKVAVDDELIARNPVDKVEAPKVRPRRQRFLTPDQVERLAEACETRQAGAGTLVRFLAWSGLRWGEAVALRVGSVNRERRRVKVEQAATEVSGKLVFGSTKTHEDRTVLPPRAVLDLLDLDRDPEALVFTAPAGGPLRSSNFRRDVWLPAVAEAGLDGLVPHDLRDTAASLAIAAGANIKAVQNMLGHSSAAMTLDIYGGRYDADQEELADRLEALHAGSVTEQGRNKPSDVSRLATV